MTETTRSICRKMGLAAVVALTALVVATPVYADGGSGWVDSTQDSPLDWATRTSEDGVRWSDVSSDPSAADVVVDQGISPTGVEWTQTVRRDPDGVKWTRLEWVAPDGSTRTQTMAVAPSGTSLSLVVGVRADGSAYVSSRFANAQAGVFTRRARGSHLDGVEWTRLE